MIMASDEAVPIVRESATSSGLVTPVGHLFPSPAQAEESAEKEGRNNAIKIAKGVRLGPNSQTVVQVTCGRSGTIVAAPERETLER